MGIGGMVDIAVGVRRAPGVAAGEGLEVTEGVSRVQDVAVGVRTALGVAAGEEVDVTVGVSHVLDVATGRELGELTGFSGADVKSPTPICCAAKVGTLLKSRTNSKNAAAASSAVNPKETGPSPRPPWAGQ